MDASRLELDWEEGLFRGLLALWKKLRPERSDVEAASTAWLDQERNALAVLAQILAAEPVRVLAARDVGGVRGRELLLPRSIGLADELDRNRALYRVRTAISAAMRRMTRGERVVATQRVDPALASLRQAARAIDWLEAELPGFAELYREAAALELRARPPLERFRGRERALEALRQAALRGDSDWLARLDDEAFRHTASGPRSSPILLFGEWLSEPEACASAEQGLEPQRPNDIRTELAAPHVDALEIVTLDPKEQEDAVLLHTFEKAEALDSYRGGARDLDGQDELNAHQEALDEVDLGALIRSDCATQSLLKADFDLGLAIPDAADAPPTIAGLPYDEWDQRSKSYRRGWCTVYPLPFRQENAAWPNELRRKHQRLVRDLRQRLERHRAALAPLDRQLDGDDFDLAAIVDVRASLRAGRTPDPRLYVRSVRRQRDFATTVLLDVSLSSDSWIQDQRVLDISREAIGVLGEVTDQLGDRLEILAFASHTRNRCHVWELKRWNDPWSKAARRLGALEPQGYTRIGPAVRHATREALRAPAERRLLLLISDGKPTDYDRYEGSYGIADVRHAVLEAEQVGVVCHALAVDVRAKDTLPAQFGPGGWDILSRPQDLISALTRVYGKLTSTG